jgi:GTP cyclohydrolase II
MHNLVLESSTILPTGHGTFKLVLFRDKSDNALVPVMLKEPLHDPVIVRVHSECFTGETLGSQRCDCKDQLEKSLEYIGKNNGMIIYLFQEGRGIGLLEKIKAYALQDTGKDTVEANLELGHEPDARDYGPAVAILKEYGIERIRLITNNPDKIKQVEQKGIKVIERIALDIEAHTHNEKYLDTKRLKFNHLL